MIVGIVGVLFFIYMYLYQRKYAEMYMSYDSGSESEGFYGGKSKPKSKSSPPCRRPDPNRKGFYKPC